jgi:ABC-2 type transport system permease protein
MKRAWLIARKELRVYFSTPLAYVLLGFFAFLTAYFFAGIILQVAQMQVRGGREVSTTQIADAIYGNIMIIFMFLIPLITMRSFVAERTEHTLELLVTSPLRVWELVLGKFLGFAVMLVAFLAVLFVYPGFIIGFGNPDVAPLLTRHFGLFCLGLAFGSMGIFMSAVSPNWIVAGLGGFLLSLGLWVIHYLGNTVSGFWSTVFQSVGALTYYENFTKGVISTADVAYFVSFCFFWLFATYRHIDSQSWRS